jgi:hypothetical protein
MCRKDPTLACLIVAIEVVLVGPVAQLHSMKKLISDVGIASSPLSPVHPSWTATTSGAGRGGTATRAELRRPGRGATGARSTA